MTRTNIKELAKQRFIAVPKLLLYGEEYKALSGNAFKTYIALYDRFTLSIKNGWVDEENNVYFVYDLEELSEITCIGKTALRNARKQLKEIGLLEEVNTGRNNRIYLAIPQPKDEAEAKYIITDEEDFEDTSKVSKEERKLKSEQLQGNKNARKTDESTKRNFDRLSPSNQQQENNEKSEKRTKVQNVTSDSSKRTTSDNELMKLNKDIKDIKDSQNAIIKQSFDSHSEKNEEQLIDDIIDNEHLVDFYGSRVVEAIKTYSFKSLETFKVYINKLEFSLKSVEKEKELSLNTIDNEAVHDELYKTFKRVILQYKKGEVNNINNYLFSSFKKVFESYADMQINEPTIHVPLHTWTKGSD